LAGVLLLFVLFLGLVRISEILPSFSFELESVLVAFCFRFGVLPRARSALSMAALVYTLAVGL